MQNIVNEESVTSWNQPCQHNVTLPIFLIVEYFLPDFLLLKWSHKFLRDTGLDDTSQCIHCHRAGNHLQLWRRKHRLQSTCVFFFLLHSIVSYRNNQIAQTNLGKGSIAMSRSVNELIHAVAKCSCITTASTPLHLHCSAAFTMGRHISPTIVPPFPMHGSGPHHSHQ